MELQNGIRKVRQRWARISEKKQFFLAYTGGFLLLCLLIFSWHFVSGSTFVWDSDGWDQHYKALVYYGRYLRSIGKTLLESHKLIIPTWDFNIGEGSDILTSLHYYVIGDPLNLLSVFVPVKYMWILYDVLIVLRLYLAGLFFSIFCFQTGHKNRFGVLAGTFTYAFCTWGLVNAARHPYFLNPMVYLPLLLIGVEQILRKKRPLVLAVAVFLSALSNFYFFYMLVILVVVYVAVRLISLYRKEPAKMVKPLIHISLSSILGVLMSAIVLLPVLTIFLASSRMSAEYGTRLLYPLSYYSKLPGILLSVGGSYWLYMGYSVTTLIALFLLFRKKKQYTALKVFLIIGVVIMLFPFFGQALNGFGYITNRWSWGFAMLCAYILTAMWPELMKLSGKEVRYLFICTILYSSVCFLLEYSRTRVVMASLVFLFTALIILFPTGEFIFSIRRRQVLALVVTLCSIFNHSFWLYAPSAGDYVSESCQVDKISQMDLTESEAVRNTAAVQGVEEFFRYSGQGLTHNADMMAGISSTEYYWSISNPYAAEFRSQLGTNRSFSYNWLNYDGCTALTSLAAVRYYVVPMGTTSMIPYGFTYASTMNIKETVTQEALEELKKELGTEELGAPADILISKTAANYDVYQNKYALPLAYTYENSMSQEQWNTLDSVKKREALLQSVVVEDSDANEEWEPFSQVLDYTVTCNSNEVTQQGNSFVVTQNGASITLQFQGLADSETYFVLDGIRYDGSSEYELYFGDDSVDPLNLYNRTRWELYSHSEKRKIIQDRIFWLEPQNHPITLNSSLGNSETVEYFTPLYQFYCGRHDYAINLGYREEPVTSIKVTFPHTGRYSFDSLQVICQPMEHYGDQVEKLKQDTLEHLEIGKDTVTGEITLEKEKWLCFSIPYSKGWQAYVDGEKAKLCQANVQYMALKLPAGVHTVRLSYETPFLKVGMCISLAGFGIFAVTAIVLRRRRNRKFSQVM